MTVRWTALAVEDRMIAAESTLQRPLEETLCGSPS
jgi:hypothetical protein